MARLLYRIVYAGKFAQLIMKNLLFEENTLPGELQSNWPKRLFGSQALVLARFGFLVYVPVNSYGLVGTVNNCNFPMLVKIY